MKLIIYFFIFLGGISFIGNNGFGQDRDFVTENFSGTRVLSNHSVEMIPYRSLEVIIAHKFGDIAGASGGLENFYGFDDLADVRIAFEYGLLEQLDIGVGRNKGVGLISGIVDGYAKYRIVQQANEGSPLTAVFVSSLMLPYKKAIDDESSILSYPTFIHRLSFTNQLLLTRKFGERFTVQLNGGYNHRNFVDFVDVNGLFFAGLSGRLRVTKTFGFLAEYNYLINRPSQLDEVYQDPLSFGLEILTGGHSFILNFSNARALNENLFIPYTTSNWLDGQWRFGFSINRKFKL